MAFGMIELGKLPPEAQEEILNKLSSKDVCPIEIDEVIYYIPPQVNDLIETLYEESNFYKKKVNGISQDKT